MKKILLVLVLLGFGLSSVMAQEADAIKKKRDEKMYLKYNKVWNDRKQYFNFSYANQTISSVENGAEYKSDWAAALTSGKTFYLHKRPLARMIKFGLDWTWFDLNAAQYSFVDTELFKDRERNNLYQAEIGMHVGPSVTINPVHHLKVSAYYRLAPSYSALFDADDEGFYHNFCLFNTVGAAISWKVLSVGIEMRSGKANYDGIEFGEFGPGKSGEPTADCYKLKTESVRFYFGFRF